MKTLRPMFLLLLLSLMFSGCIAIGRTSGGRWFIWPGGLTLLILIIIVALLLRRR